MDFIDLITNYIVRPVLLLARLPRPRRPPATDCNTKEIMFNNHQKRESHFRDSL
jgi:hypothetical protein